MRVFWLCLGWLSLAIGVIGIGLPIMPTVPFLLVSAWAFSRSSPELRAKIVNHPKYGPPIRAWQERGVIALPAKIWAVSAMSAGVCLSWWLGLDQWIVLVQAAICATVAIFVVTRPSR